MQVFLNRFLIIHPKYIGMTNQALQKTEILFILVKYYAIHDNIFKLFVFCIHCIPNHKSIINHPVQVLYIYRYIIHMSTRDVNFIVVLDRLGSILSCLYFRL